MTPGEQVDFCPWFVLANLTCFGDKKMMVWLACLILNFLKFTGRKFMSGREFEMQSKTSGTEQDRAR